MKNPAKPSEKAPGKLFRAVEAGHASRGVAPFFVKAEKKPMNNILLAGIFLGVKKYYKSRNGRYYFNFKFEDKGSYIETYCTYHPSLDGRDSNPDKTHLFSSGKLCFVSGREPRSMARAEALARQWAEYFLEYRLTGTTQS